MSEDPTQTSTCDWCESPGATFRLDPFRDEVYGEKVLMWICDDCYWERRQEV